MNSVETLFQLPWIARLGWTLLHFLWQGALIAALLAVLRRFTGDRSAAPQRYAAACGALALMALAPVATFLALSAGDGLATVPAAAAHAASGGWAATAHEAVPTPWPDLVSPWLGAAWILGVLLCLLRLAGGWIFTARLARAQARSAPPEWHDNLVRLMACLGITRPVRLSVSALVESPSVLGWLRPVILMPVGALAGLPADHIEALLAHELAHIRRHDYLVNLLQSLGEALLFYHPAVWWVSRIIRAEREYCCDDLAVAAAGGDVVTYARALAEVESCRPAHVPAIAAAGGSLRNRIRRLVDPSQSQSHSLPSGAAAWALAATLLVSAGALAVRAAESPAPPQEAVVDLNSLWPDTVKQGNMLIEVRGLGTMTAPNSAEVKIAEQQAPNVIVGLPVQIDFRRKELVAGLVQLVRPGVSDSKVTVEVVTTAPLPDGVVVGSIIDTTIKVGELHNVLYVGRPVFGSANSTVMLFKVDPDGQHAERVKVQFGKSSVNTIEVKSGLQLGDKVILNDMAAYDGVARLTLK